MIVRPRSERDLGPCEAIARVVHALDGYPPYLPNDDSAGLLDSPDALRAFVAEVADEILGHVAPHRRSSSAVMRLATTALGAEPSRVGVVARLFVAPMSRRLGVGRRLLEAAVREATDRGLVPIVDVWTELAGAMALYETAGWRRLGTVGVRFADGTTMEEAVYAAP